MFSRLIFAGYQNFDIHRAYTLASMNILLLPFAPGINEMFDDLS